MKGQHQIKILQAIEGGHVALSRKDGSFQVFRAFSAGDGTKLLEWVAKELGLEIVAPITSPGLPAANFTIERWQKATADLYEQLEATRKPFEIDANGPQTGVLEETKTQLADAPLPDRKPTRSRAEKQRQFVEFIIARGGTKGWARIPLREICAAMQVTEPTALDIANRAIHERAIEKRIVKGDRPEDRGRSYSEWRIAVEQAQPAEKESGHQATADEPKTVAAPPAPEVPPAAQAVKLEAPAGENIAVKGITWLDVPAVPILPTAVAEPVRLPDGVDGDPGLEKRARKVLLCLHQIAERQGQQQFEVQLTKLAEKAGVPKPSMPAILPVLRAEHDVIVNEPLQRGWGWRFDLSKARAA
jgi:hypothetical protein